MKLIIYSVLVILLCNCAKKQNSDAKNIAEPIKKNSAISIVNFKELKPLLEKQNDTTYVVNFWATWCKPCVEELPAFQKLHAESLSKKLKVLLISLDFPSQIEKQLVPFINKRNLKPEVIVLNDPDTNSWIPKISAEWSGAIPATIIYNKSKRDFYEESFDYEKLQTILKTF